MTTAEAREALIAAGGYDTLRGEARFDDLLDALVAAVRAEEREKIVTAIRKENKRWKRNKALWMSDDIADFVAALGEGP